MEIELQGCKLELLFKKSYFEGVQQNVMSQDNEELFRVPAIPSPKPNQKPGVSLRGALMSNYTTDSHGSGNPA